MSSFLSLLKKTASMSLAIFINKPVGLLRDILRIRYFGVSLMADAFSVAWRIPNALRKIFAEGALSSALVPILVEIDKKNGKESVNEVTTAIFIIMQCIVILICVGISYGSFNILSFISPGSPDRVLFAVPMLQILIYFTLFMSTSVILGSTLQILNVFLIGPMSQLFLNVALIVEFFLCIYYNFSSITLSWMIFLNGFIILGIHIKSYLNYGFAFKLPTKKSIPYVKHFFKKLIPNFLGVGLSEINGFIDQAMASYLPVGSQSLFDYISGFIRLPLQIFGSAFGTVSITYFSQLAIEKQKRFSFYLYHSLSTMLFFTLPFICLFYFFSYSILETLLLSEKFTIEYVKTGSTLLKLFSGIIVFSSLNRILLNIFYAFQNTAYPTFVSLLATLLNTGLNYIFISIWGLKGIIVATVLAEAFRTILLFLGIIMKLKIYIPLKKYINYSFNLIVHNLVLSIGGFILYKIIELLLKKTSSEYIIYLLFHTLCYWFWVGPIVLLFMYIYIKSIKYFKTETEFIKPLSKKIF